MEKAVVPSQEKTPHEKYLEAISKGKPDYLKICVLITRQFNCDEDCLQYGAKETEDDCPNGDLSFTYCKAVRDIASIEKGN